MITIFVLRKIILEILSWYCFPLNSVFMHLAYSYFIFSKLSFKYVGYLDKMSGNECFSSNMHDYNI